MTKLDYFRLADILRKYIPCHRFKISHVWAEMINEIVVWLHTNNNKFDEKKFREYLDRKEV